MFTLLSSGRRDTRIEKKNTFVNIKKMSKKICMKKAFL